MLGRICEIVDLRSKMKGLKYILYKMIEIIKKTFEKIEKIMKML